MTTRFVSGLGMPPLRGMESSAGLASHSHLGLWGTLLLLGNFGQGRFGQKQQARYRDRIFQPDADHLCRIDDAASTKSTYSLRAASKP